MAKPKLPRGICLRGSKYFVDVTVNGKRSTATCDTLEQAVERRRELHSALEAGKDIKTARSNARVWTLREALDKTLSMPPKEGWRGCSYEKQATLNVEDAIAFMGPELTVDSIDRALIDAWLHSCEAKRNRGSTINRKLSSLSKVLKVAVDYDGLHALRPRRVSAAHIRVAVLKPRQ